MLGLLGALVAGCSSTSPIPSIVVGSITAESTIGAISPSKGTYFAQVSVTMTNDTPTPYSQWSYYYQLTTKAGLGPSPPAGANGAVADPCSLDVTLGPEEANGAPKFTCNLVFEVPCGDTPFGLIYTLTGSTTAVPSFTPPSCS